MIEIISFIKVVFSGTEIGKYIISIILLLLILCIFILICNVIKIIREKIYLKRTKTKFKESENEQYSTEKFVESILDGIPNSIVKRRITTLYKIRQLHSISIDLLDRLDDLEEKKDYAFIRFVTNVLLVLGLLGTVFGLSISIEQIMPAINNAKNLGSVTTLVEAMSATMGGLKTAFNATLAGLISTFILAAIVHVCQIFERSFIYDLEYFTTYELLPKILISTEIDAKTLYVEAIAKSSQDIAKAADVLERSRDGIGAIVSNLVHATEETSHRTTDLFNFVDKFRDSVSQLIGYKDDINDTYKKIDDVLRSINDSQLTAKIIGEIVDQAISSSMKATSEASESVRDIFMKDIQKVSESQSIYISSVNDTTKAINNFSKENATSLATSINDSLNKALDMYRQEFAEISKRENISRMIATEANDDFRKFVNDSILIHKEVNDDMKIISSQLHELIQIKNNNTL